ncbi:MAG: hypothetical protein ABL866_09445 [Devosia sp.]
MKKPVKSPPKKRNLAAKALRGPLFRPRVVEDPKAYKRNKKVPLPPEDDDQIN